MEDPNEFLKREGPTKIDIAVKAISVALEEIRTDQPMSENQIAVLGNSRRDYELQYKLKSNELRLARTPPDPSKPEIGRQRLNLVRGINRLKKHISAHDGLLFMARKSAGYRQAEKQLTPLIMNLEEAHRDDLVFREVDLYSQMADDLDYIVEEFRK